MFKQLWIWLCRKIGLYIVFYKPDGQIRYSKQSLMLLREMPNFDYKDFEKWFCQGMAIGSHSILEYLIYKKKRGKNGTQCK